MDASMLTKLDTLQGAELIDYDVTELPLMLPTSEVVRITGWSKNYLFNMERDKWISSRQNRLAGTKYWRTDEVMRLCGYNPIRRK